MVRSKLILLSLIVLAMVVPACTTESKPTVVIVSPPSGSEFRDGEDVAVQSVATDAKGIVRVELIVDNVIVRTDTAPSPQGQPTLNLIQKWQATPGAHTIVVRAYNTANAMSDPVAISINVLTTTAQASSSSSAVSSSSAASSSVSSVVSTTSSATSSASSSVASSPASGCTNNAAFVSDVTVPDGTSFNAGQTFDKTWRVTNNGTCTWGAGYQFVFVAGEAMATTNAIPVPVTAPGATIDLTIAMTAPATPGQHSGQWRLRASNGTLFGPTLIAKINTLGAVSSSSVSSVGGCSGTPNIASFTATSLGGGNWLLQWGAVTNADSVEIDQGIGGVATPGSRTVTAPAIGTRTYTMTARCGANTITAQATVGTLLLVTPVITIIPPLLPSPTPTPAPSVVQILKQVSIPAGTTGAALAECPSGSIVTGGGFASPSSLSTEVYTQSKQGNGWQVYLYNNTSSSQLINAYAICLSGASSGATTTQVLNQVSVAANTTGSATATCPSGVLTGGGFASQSDLSTKVYTQSKQGNGWQVYLSNKTASSQLVNAYAICLTGAGTSSTQILKQVSVSAGTTGSALAECPSGTLVTGGGYASQTEPGTKVYTQSKEGNGWRVYMNNTTGSSQLLNAYAICTSF